MFTGKIAVSQRFLTAVLHLLGSLFQLNGMQFLHHGFRFFSGSFLACLGVDRFEYLCHQLHLGAARRHGEHIAVASDGVGRKTGIPHRGNHSIKVTLGKRVYESNWREAY